MRMTELSYLEDMTTLRGSASLVARRDEDGKVGLALDRTYFYPQGGGQASDVGVLRHEDLVFQVGQVYFDHGTVWHVGRTASGDMPEPGTLMQIEVESATRRRNSRLQSGGHLVVNAMRSTDHDLQPTKGYHFPNGPYVEFSGVIDESLREEALRALQAEVDKLIALDLPVTWEMVASERLAEVCEHVPARLPTNKPIRVVYIDGLAQPCGGTHVSRLGELTGMTISRIRTRKGNTKVSYTLPDLEVR